MGDRPTMRIREVLKFFGISRTTLWRRQKNDPNFPKQFPIGADGVQVFDREQVENYYKSLRKTG